jgi:hypothetical protein
MENERIVRFFLSTMLEQNVVNVVLNPQEFTYKTDAKRKETASNTATEMAVEAETEEDDDRMMGYSVFRVDFIATIQLENGEQKKILIEVQKSEDEDDLMRFRNYLAKQYAKYDTINGVPVVLPITTIYVLGFKLHDIFSPCVKVERTYIDMVHGGPINSRCRFMEVLTHDSYVVQAGRITNRFQTRLDKLLSIFQQDYFYDEHKKILKYYPHNPGNDPEMQLLTKVLVEIGADPAERKQLEIENEAMRIFQARYGKLNQKTQELSQQAKELHQELAENQAALAENQAALAENQAALAEKEAALAENQVALAENQAALAEKEVALAKNQAALAEKEAAIAKKNEALLKMARRLLLQGVAIEDVAADTGLDIIDLEKLK